MLQLLALALHGAVAPTPDVEFDGGSACAQIASSVESVFERHQTSLPEQTRVAVRIMTNSESRIMGLEISVHANGETTNEVQTVHSCREALDYLDFYLGVWAPESTNDEVMTTAARTPAGVSTSAADMTPDLGLRADAFATATSSHSSGFGLSAGGGLSFDIAWARLGVFGSWSQPSILQGNADQATFTLHRWDLGGSFCARLGSGPPVWSPCLGVSRRNFMIPASETAPNADRKMQVLSLDAGVALTNPISDTTGLQALLLFRYSPTPTNLGEFAIGFIPPQLEVNLRLGFTWDVIDIQGTTLTNTKPLIAARRGSRTW